MTQCEQILEHLQGGPITPITALNMYGCFRLAARINDLRAEGHKIKTETGTRNGKRYAIYFLEDE